MTLAQPRELLRRRITPRTTSLLLGLCVVASAGSGCSKSSNDLFGEPEGGGSGAGGVVGSGGAPSGGGASTSGGKAGSGGVGGTSVGGTSAGGDATGGEAPANGGTAGTPAGGSGGKGGGGPVLQSGSHAFPGFPGGIHCESVTFPTAFVAENDGVHVQITVVHPDAMLLHGALAIWVQSITSTGFQACMTEDEGLNGSHLVSRLDWVAYAASAATNLGARLGRQALGSAEGRVCRSVAFATPFAAPPRVQLTANHHGATTQPRDPVTTWVEEIDAMGFRLCAEEIEGTDGALSGTNVDWLAYPSTVAASGFSAGELDVESFDGVECFEIETGCANCENVQLTVNYQRATEAATSSHDATLVWAEDMTATGLLDVCVSETSAYDGDVDAHLTISWLARQAND